MIAVRDDGTDYNRDGVPGIPRAAQSGREWDGRSRSCAVLRAPGDHARIKHHAHVIIGAKPVADVTLIEFVPDAALLASVVAVYQPASASSFVIRR